MGVKLEEIYEKVKKIGGYKARMRLAVMTGIPGSKAVLEPDTPENIKKFNEALTEIEKEFI